MKAYSMDLRERIVLARESGESVVSVAQRFGVCTKTVRAYQSLASKGQLSPRPIPGKAPRLRPEQEAAFVAMVADKSDWTVEQLSLEWQRRSGVLLPSGVFGRADAKRLHHAGADALLVGESLMRSGQAARAIEELLGG